MRDQIEASLQAEFAPELLQVIDESDQHIGHAGYREGGNTHFRVQIKAQAFNGLSRVAAQRLIYKALAAQFEDGMHALALDVSGTL